MSKMIVNSKDRQWKKASKNSTWIERKKAIIASCRHKWEGPDKKLDCKLKNWRHLKANHDLSRL